MTISVGLEPLEVQRTIVDVLKQDGSPIGECILQLNDRLHVVTSIIDLAPMEIEMLSRASREKILDRALKKQISLSVLPSLYEDIQKIAYVQRRSVSEVMSAMMEEHREVHVGELSEYKKIKG